MTTLDLITPTSAILDDSGHDWIWAFVVFRPIEGFPGYLVASNGSVWSRWNSQRKLGDWRRLRGITHRQGYRCVYLFRDGQKCHWLVHRLVAMTFLGPPAPGQEVCHNNGRYDDNRLENLRWDTRSENVKDGIRHGTVRTPHPKGSHHGMAKLTETDIPEIRRLYRSGQVAREIAPLFGVSMATIYKIVKGQHWGHVLS